LEEKNIRGGPALVIALAAGDSVLEAAQKAGVSERTVYRRLSDNDFMLKVHKARTLMIQQAVGKLAVNCTKASEVLVKLLDSPSERIRLQAAKALLDQNNKLSEAWAVDFRLGALEELLMPSRLGMKKKK
jgi:hypothetical protein